MTVPHTGRSNLPGRLHDWRMRRVGYVQGRVIGEGQELGLESEMTPRARGIVTRALHEFETRWPQPSSLASTEEERDA